MLCEEKLFTDPAENAAVPAHNEEMLLESHGSRIYGRILIPAAESREERFPVALLLHGYPGLEANLDITQALRQAGIAVAYFFYRGVWGSHGEYSFTHLIEDVEYVLQFLREHAEEYQIDPQRMYLIGHSMGGFAALNTLARGADVKGAVLVAPCDLSHRFEKEPDIYDLLVHVQDGGYFHTATETSLDEDVRANAPTWRFTALAERIDRNMPMHFIGGRDDTITPPKNHVMPMLKVLQDRGMNVSYTELPDGHSFPGHRIALTRLIYQRIEQMEQGQ